MAGDSEHSEKVLVSRLALDGERWRLAAENELVGMGARAVDVLLGALHHANSQVRFHAVRALSRLHDPRAIGALAPCLGDSENNFAVAIAAEKALVSFGGAAVAVLLEAAKSGPEQVRPRAVRALGNVPDAPASAFQELTRSQDWTVRAQAYTALSKRLGDQAVPDLLRGLQDSEDWVRRAVAEALVELRRGEGRVVIQAVMDNPDEEFNQHVWAENLLDRLEELERTGDLVRT